MDQNASTITQGEHSGSDQVALEQALAALRTLQDTVSQSLETFDSCFVFTMALRNDIMDSVKKLKQATVPLNCEQLSDFVSVLEIVTLTAFQSDQHKDHSSLKLLQMALTTAESGYMGSDPNRTDSIRQLTDHLWSWIERKTI